MHMTESNRAFAQALVKSLVGERGHIPIARGVQDITAELAGKRMEGAPYTIYQLLKHMNYWQIFMLTFMDGGKPQMPANVAESWSSVSEPESEEEWRMVVEQFMHGVNKAVDYAQSEQLDNPLEHFPTETKAGILRNIASHNSYHLGEIVLLRRLFDAWPPPGGGYPN